MAAAFLPPLDFACSKRRLATDATQSASQAIQSDHPEDDGNPEYATKTASSVVSDFNETASVAASIQPDSPDQCGSSNTRERKPNDDSKKLRQLSRLFSRHGTVNSRRSDTLVKRATNEKSSNAGAQCTTPAQRTWSTVSKRSARQNELKSYRCDIYAATSGDFRATLDECRQRVLETDGRLLDDFAYPGGFLFQIPSNSASPLATGLETAGGGRISIAEWTKPFPQPVLQRSEVDAVRWSWRAVANACPAS